MKLCQKFYHLICDRKKHIILVATRQPSNGGISITKPNPSTVTSKSNTPSKPGEPSAAGAETNGQQAAGKPRRTGGLALFFRKVYSLAHIRLETLCTSMQVSS